MTLEKLDNLEERIQKPGYLLLLILVLLLLIVGFVDLIDTSSKNPIIFGRYSLKYAVLIAGYVLLLLAWASLLLRPNDDRWLTKSLDFIQKRPILALLILLGILITFVFMLIPARRVHVLLLEFPALQVTITVILLLAAGLILFYQWGADDRPQTWRKIAAAILAFFILVEILIQLLAYFGLLPSITRIEEAFAPYARIYHTEEGMGNGLANSYGRYTDEFELLPESERIAVIGGSFIQALQVDPEQDLGMRLEDSIRQTAAQDPAPEVLTLGFQDRGPAVYLSSWMLKVILENFEPTEALVFFNLAQDFQTVDDHGQGYPFFAILENGELEIQGPESHFIDKHRFEHATHHGHEGFHLIRFLGTHYLTPRLLGTLLTPSASGPPPGPPNSDIDLYNGFVFNEETNDLALEIAAGHVARGLDQLDEAGISTKLVTIPVFTDAFYEQDKWNTEFGGSDLLLPEEELRAFAAQNGTPFLGLGSYMAAKGLTPAEVQQLFYKEGRGHLTPAGHELAAQAAYECFFAESIGVDTGCDRR